MFSQHYSEQPKCGNKLNAHQENMAHTYKEILFSLKGNSTWINLENIMLSEISQYQKNKYCMIPLI
jgi:hypothetical protein